MRSRSYHRLPLYLTTGTQVIASVRHFIASKPTHLWGKTRFWGALDWSNKSSMCVYLANKWASVQLNEAACYCRGRPLLRCNCLRGVVFTFTIHPIYLRPVQPVCRFWKPLRDAQRGRQNIRWVGWKVWSVCFTAFISSRVTSSTNTLQPKMKRLPHIQ